MIILIFHRKEKMNKKISIIVPVYNLENYLERCVRSLLQQSYNNLEVILVDDGSTDNSSEMCDILCKEDRRVFCIHKKNGGLSSARNIGLDAASGDYILFVDGDDYIHPDMVRTMYEGMVFNDVKICICDYQHFHDEKEIMEPDSAVDEEVIGKEEILQRLYIPERARYIMSCCKLVKREIFNGIRFPEGRYREDEFTTYKLLLKAGNILCIDCKYYYYYQREDSIMHSFQVKRETDYYDALLERHNYLEETGCSKKQICRDSEFCIKQLYNSIFLWHGMRDMENKKYIKAYSQMYDLCKKYCGRKIIGIRYHVARYAPELLYALWKAKKILEELILKNDRQNRMEIL